MCVRRILGKMVVLAFWVLSFLEEGRQKKMDFQVGG